MRPFVQLSVLLTAPSFSFFKGSYATPNPNPSPQSELTYVVLGVGSELPEPLNSDPSATEWVAPLGTASGETTFLFNEVETAVTDKASTTVTGQVTETGTLIASASGFTLSILSTGIQGLVGAEAECHFTAAGSGECVQNLHGEGDLLKLTFGGTVATHALSVSGASATATALAVTSGTSRPGTSSASSFGPFSAPGTQGSSASSGSSTASPTSINPSDSIVTPSPATTSTRTLNNGASNSGFDFRTIIMVIMGILAGIWDPPTKKQPISEINLKVALEGLGMTMSQFIDLCILLGCDYLEPINGVGPKSALKLIREHNGLKGVVKHLQAKTAEKEKALAEAEEDEEEGEEEPASKPDDNSDGEEGPSSKLKPKPKKKGIPAFNTTK